MVISQKLFYGILHPPPQKLRWAGLLVTLILLCTASCNTTEPPPPPPPTVVEEPILTLELDDTHCTEAWLQLTTKDLELPAELTLKQFNPTGDSVSQILILNTQDSLLYIDSLLPNQNYYFQVFSLSQANQHPASSIKLQVTTMDTTSHNFTFEMITFGGQIGSSVLYDVAIIDESNIIAVGDIWIKDDTSSLGYTKYNAVHWDGTKWELKRIYFPTVCGQTDVTPYPARSIFAFNGNEIWISSSGDKIAILKDGEQTDMFCLPPNVSMSINKIWGRSSNDLYVVGYAGNIAHYNGTSWSKIESGTTLNINDIWGDYNQKTNEWEILAVGGNILAGYDNIILQIQSNNSIQKINSDSVNWPLGTLWFQSGKNYYIALSGIFQKHNLNEGSWKNDIYSITTYTVFRIRGQEINDLAAAGGAGELLHFNGYDWRSFIEVTGIPGNYYGTSIYANTIVAVGQGGRQATITIGRR